MSLFRNSEFFLFLVCIALLSVGSTGGEGCVGTIAGIPQHNTVDGASALNAQFADIYTSATCAKSPGNLYITLSDRLLLVDRNKTISRIAGGSPSAQVNSLVASQAALNWPSVSFSPVCELILADQSSIRQLDVESGMFNMLAGNLSSGNGWAPDGSLALASQVRLTSKTYIQCSPIPLLALI
jgi:hypothetical protein